MSNLCDKTSAVSACDFFSCVMSCVSSLIVSFTSVIDVWTALRILSARLFAICPTVCCSMSLFSKPAFCSMFWMTSRIFPSIGPSSVASFTASAIPVSSCIRTSLWVFVMCADSRSRFCSTAIYKL
ncbi:hypothetical protein F5B21DRAFT_453489 [Xylaria acuta]|nr:hypothetical protein F5B21DRAFT_453489 [Xylaria acuta]